MFYYNTIFNGIYIYIFIFEHNIILGASSSRRDFGRGYTAPQWARYLSRDLCAESMEKFVRTAAVPGVSLADILTDPRTLIKDIEKANAQTIRSSKTPTKLKDMLKKKSSVLYNKVCIFRPMCVY